ncbi:MAG: translation elongation factor 4 [Parcubacteria group bacterium]|nr:translation elongation factor 4 [Parcubacteria group bacterium]MCR4342464.1 translation elongation factor 4 [Patescibacteria group bacterium]
METKNIRNFSIIAHIDHGKSTLADRLIDKTNAVEKRKMREQVLDVMELERERGITIKMQPVRMSYKLQDTNYQLNLIDTPGHIDFSYEVSRALKAVEGTILLVDATQGVQAQTFSTLEMAEKSGLVIIPVLNKIDMPAARVDVVLKEVMDLLGCDEKDVLKVSAKTGEGVDELIAEIIKRIPAPVHGSESGSRALVFDFEYSNHQGVIVYARVTDGSFKKGDELVLIAGKEKFIAGEVGIFTPERKEISILNEGETGYIVTNIKKPNVAVVGDTVTSFKKPLPPLSGYFKPSPVVWASIYPEGQDDFDDLKQALMKLSLSDSSLEFEEETQGALGRGFRCGFLGMLHLEIVLERLKREFSLDLITASPTISYEVEFVSGKKEIIRSPIFFPETHLIKKVFEPWVNFEIITTSEKVGDIMKLCYEHEALVADTNQFGKERISMNGEMPLRELMRGFFDKLKSVSSGYASISYKIGDMREADVVKLEILVADEPIVAFTKIISRRRVNIEAEEAVEKLHKILPRQLFVIKIQAKALGRIISSRAISAMKKDVTGYLYGGDISRKKKLWEKQKKGKKKKEAFSKVNIPQEVFLKMMKS